MAIGSITGLTKSIFDYFNPSALNPIVLIFHTSIIILWILSVRWIYFKNGAVFLESHPGIIEYRGLRGRSNITAKQIKMFFPLMLLGGIAAMVMMWVFKIAIPAL